MTGFNEVSIVLEEAHCLDLAVDNLVEPFWLVLVQQQLSFPPLSLPLVRLLEFSLVKPHKHTLQLAKGLLRIDRAKVDFDLFPKFSGPLLPFLVLFLCLLGSMGLLVTLSLSSLHLKEKVSECEVRRVA